MVDYALTQVGKNWKCEIKGKHVVAIGVQRIFIIIFLVYGESKGSGIAPTKLEAKNEAAAKVLAWFKATESGS